MSFKAVVDEGQANADYYQTQYGILQSRELARRTIASLKADVTVYHDGQQADARSVLALMGLSARGGDTIKVVADGPDAAEALRRIGKLVEIEFEE